MQETGLITFLPLGEPYLPKTNIFYSCRDFARKPFLKHCWKHFQQGTPSPCLNHEFYCVPKHFFRYFINKKLKLTAGELIFLWSFPPKALHHLFFSCSFQDHSGIHQPQNPCQIRFFTYFHLWIFHFPFSTQLFGSLWSLLSNQVIFGLPF